MQSFKEFYDKWSRTAVVEKEDERDAEFQRPTPEIFVDDYAGSVYRSNTPIQRKTFVNDFEARLPDARAQKLREYYIHNQFVRANAHLLPEGVERSVEKAREKEKIIARNERHHEQLKLSRPRQKQSTSKRPHNIGSKFPE